MQSSSKTVSEYLQSLPADRRKIIAELRKNIKKHLPAGYKEGMQYGMIGYFVPHKLYPPGYHVNPEIALPFLHIAAQKNFNAIYLMCLYPSKDQLKDFQQQWRATGKKLDMGKSCIRFKALDDLALSVLMKTIKRMTVRKYIQTYEAALKTKK